MKIKIGRNIKCLIFIISYLFTVSCNSQIDIEKIEFDTDLKTIIDQINKVKREADVITAIPSYETSNLDNLKFGDVKLSAYQVKEGYISDYNNVYFLVDNYTSNKYKGVTLELVSQEEGEELLQYLYKKYGKPKLKYIETDTDKNQGSKYFWMNEKLNKLIYLERSLRSKKDGRKFWNTSCIIAVKGLQLKLDDENDPELVKKMLKADPNIFMLSEHFKRKFPVK